MNQVSTRDFVMALLLKPVLDRAARAEPGKARASTAAAAVPAPPRDGEAPARPGRAVPALVLLAVGALTMLLFESAVTRVIGVIALFGFIVAGAFAIADPRWLGSAPELGDRREERT